MKKRQKQEVQRNNSSEKWIETKLLGHLSLFMNVCMYRQRRIGYVFPANWLWLLHIATHSYLHPMDFNRHWAGIAYWGTSPGTINTTRSTFISFHEMVKFLLVAIGMIVGWHRHSLNFIHFEMNSPQVGERQTGSRHKETITIGFKAQRVSSYKWGAAYSYALYMFIGDWVNDSRYVVWLRFASTKSLANSLTKLEEKQILSSSTSLTQCCSHDDCSQCCYAPAPIRMHYRSSATMSVQRKLFCIVRTCR